MKILNPIKLLVVLYLFLSNIFLYGQHNDYPYFYRPKSLIDVPQSPYGINKDGNSQSLFSERGKNVDLIGRALYGRPDGTFVEGSYLYVTTGGALLIYDVSSPSNPVLTGHVYVDGLVNGSYIPHIFVSNGYAYLPTLEDGLQIINVLDPVHPVKVSQFDTPGVARGIFVLDSIAYVGDFDGGLRIVNVSDPSHPKEIGFFKKDNHFILSVWVVGKYAYVTTNLSLLIIDVSNPLSPVEVGGYNKSASAVQVVNNIAFLATQNGLLILDVSNVKNITLLGQYVPIISGSGFDNLISALFIKDEYAYIGTLSTQLIVVDIFDPTHPIEVSRLQYIMGGSYSLYFSNSYVYSASGSWIQSIDVSDVNKPVNSSIIYTGDWSVYVTAAGSFAYVSNMWVGGLRIVDISNPSEAKEIATYWDSTKIGRKFYASSFIVDTLLYVGILGIGSGELQILSIKNPRHPYLVGTYSNSTGEFAAGEMIIRDTLAYITDYSSGLWILNIKNPAQPKYVGHYKSPINEAFTFGLKVSGNYAYVAAFKAGLLIIDISDPTKPKLAANSKGLDDAIDVDVYENYAYVTAGFFSLKRGLRIINISDPRNPIEEKFFDFPDIVPPQGTPKPVYYGIKVKWPYAYIGANWAGLRIVDISNPLLPKEAGYYHTNSYARSVYLSGGYIFVADEFDGLYILRSTLPTNVDNKNEDQIPSKFFLSQNFPNPFNPETNFNYHLPNPVNVSLKIYNILGQEIRTLVNQFQQAGTYAVRWDGKDNYGKAVSSGVYLYSINAGLINVTKKMMVVR